LLSLGLYRSFTRSNTIDSDWGAVVCTSTDDEDGDDDI